MTAAPFQAEFTGRGRLDIALQPAVPSPVDTSEFYRTSAIMHRKSLDGAVGREN
jgi:hypothetical protein